MNQLPSIVAQNYRLRKWASDIHERQQQGMSVKQWCEEHGITTKTYYYRLKRVRQACLEECEPEIVSLASVIPSVTSAADIRIGNAVIRIDEHTSVSLLKNIFKALDDA